MIRAGRIGHLLDGPPVLGLEEHIPGQLVLRAGRKLVGQQRVVSPPQGVEDEEHPSGRQSVADAIQAGLAGLDGLAGDPRHRAAPELVRQPLVEHHDPVGFGAVAHDGRHRVDLVCLDDPIGPPVGRVLAGVPLGHPVERPVARHAPDLEAARRPEPEVHRAEEPRQPGHLGGVDGVDRGVVLGPDLPLSRTPSPVEQPLLAEPRQALQLGEVLGRDGRIVRVPAQQAAHQGLAVQRVVRALHPLLGPAVQPVVLRVGVAVHKALVLGDVVAGAVAGPPRGRVLPVLVEHHVLGPDLAVAEASLDVLVVVERDFRSLEQGRHVELARHDAGRVVHARDDDLGPAGQPVGLATAARHPVGQRRVAGMKDVLLKDRQDRFGHRGPGLAPQQQAGVSELGARVDDLLQQRPGLARTGRAVHEDFGMRVGEHLGRGAERDVVLILDRARRHFGGIVTTRKKW